MKETDPLKPRPYKKCKCCLSIVLLAIGLAIIGGIIIIIQLLVVNRNQEINNVNTESPFLDCGPRYAYTPICPNETIHCNCSAKNSIGNTKWNFSTLNQCPSKNNTITLPRHAMWCVNRTDSCGSDLFAENINPENSNDSCLTSRLTIKGNPIFNHYKLQCIDVYNNENRMSEPFNISILGLPDPPHITVTSIDLNQLTVYWTTNRRTNYSVSINDTTNNTVHLTDKVNTYIFTGLKMNTVYNITIVALNCVGNSNASAFFKTSSCPFFGAGNTSIFEPLCPQDSINSTCALVSNAYNVSMLWKGSGFQCMENFNSIILTQISNSTLNKSPVYCGNISAMMTQIEGMCYASILSIPAAQFFNETTVQCYNGSTLIGNATIQIYLKAPPDRPNATLQNITESTTTVAWMPVPTATSYNVSINDTNYPFPISLTANTTSYTFINLTAEAPYSISLIAVNCAGNSEPKVLSTSKDTMPNSSPLSAGAIAGIATGVIFALIMLYA